MNRIFRSIAISISMCVLLSACSNNDKLTELKGEPITEENRKAADALSEELAGQSIELDDFDSATVTEDYVVLGRITQGGCDIEFVDKNSGETANLYSISCDANELFMYPAANGDINIFFRNQSLDLSNIAVSPEGEIKENADISFIKTAENGMPPQCMDCIGLNEEDLLWCTVDIYAKDSGLARHEGVDESFLFTTNRIYSMTDREKYCEIPESILAFGKSGDRLCMLSVDQTDYSLIYVDSDLNIAEEQVSLRGEALNATPVGSCIKDDILYYISENTIHQYNIGDGSDKEVFSLTDTGIDAGDMGENLYYFGVNGDGFDLILKNNTYCRIGHGTDARIQIVLAGIGLAYEDSLQACIAEYNSSQEKYVIKQKDYLTYDDSCDYDDALTKMNLDIVDGNYADIYCKWNGADLSYYTEKGLFADLEEFMDDELGRDSFVKSILEVNEIGGHLYTISPFFSVCSMCGAESRVTKLKKHTFAGVDKFLKKNDKSWDNVNGLMLFSDNSVFDGLIGMYLDDFVDWGAGKCDFAGNAEFERMLEISRDYKGIEVNPAKGFVQDIRDGNYILEYVMLNSVADYQLREMIYDEKVRYLGALSGKGDGAAAIMYGPSLSVCAKSDGQEAAWEFIKFFLKNAQQDNKFPVLSDRLDEYLNNAMSAEMESVFDEEKGIYEEEEKAKLYFGDHDFRFYVYHADEEDVKKVREIIDGIVIRGDNHSEVIKIIEEEVPAFLEGAKSAKETEKVIQSRVQIYLNEGR